MFIEKHWRGKTILVFRLVFMKPGIVLPGVEPTGVEPAGGTIVWDVLMDFVLWLLWEVL